MADVQKEHGFAQVALDLFAALLGEDFHAGAAAVLVEVVAGQYGPRKLDAVPIAASEVAARSGRHRTHVLKGIRDLVGWGVLVRVGTDLYRLNKDYDSWRMGDLDRRHRQAAATLLRHSSTRAHKRNGVVNQLQGCSQIATVDPSKCSQIATPEAPKCSQLTTPPLIEERARQKIEIENKKPASAGCAPATVSASPFNDLADEMCRIIGASWPTGEAFDEVARPLTISLDQHKPTKAAAIHLAYRAAKKQSPACWLLNVAARGGFVEPSRPLTPEGKPPPDKIANAAAYKPAERIRDDTTPEDRAEALRIIRAKLGRSNGHSVKGA